MTSTATTSTTSSGTARAPIPSAIWWGRTGRAFTADGINAEGRYRPLVGDYNGDGRHDILWYTPGPGPDHLWFGRTDRTWDSQRDHHRHVLRQLGGR